MCRKLLLLIAVLGLVGTVWADDPCVPDWRGDAGSTTAWYGFDTPAPTGDDGWPLRAPETSQWFYKPPPHDDVPVGNFRERAIGDGWATYWEEGVAWSGSTWIEDNTWVQGDFDMPLSYYEDNFSLQVWGDAQTWLPTFQGRSGVLEFPRGSWDMYNFWTDQPDKYWQIQITWQPAVRGADIAFQAEMEYFTLEPLSWSEDVWWEQAGWSYYEEEWEGPLSEAPEGFEAWETWWEEGAWFAWGGYEEGFWRDEGGWEDEGWWTGGDEPVWNILEWWGDESLVPTSVIALEGSWKTSAFLIHMQPNPVKEYFGLFPAVWDPVLEEYVDATIYVDQVVIDTICISEPADESGVKIHPGITLDWLAGASATTHEVYFSSDKAAVQARTALIASIPDDPCDDRQSCTTPILWWWETYYWAVDEVNGPNTWEGEVWSFTTIPYVVIDDFNHYTADPNMRETWKDHDACSPWGSYVYRSTNVEPNTSPPYSMKLQYYWKSTQPTTFTRRTFDPPQNWTKGGLAALVLQFNGDANNLSFGYSDRITATEMYVTLTDDQDNSWKVYYDGDANDLIANEWMEWNIALRDFNESPNSVDTGNIKSIDIGVNAITSLSKPMGRIWFDDIRLYVPRCVPMYAVDISSDPEGPFEGGPDCFTDYWDLKHFGACWLDIDAQPNGVPDECDICDIYPPEGDGEVNFEDYAVLMQQYWLTWLTYQPFPPEE